MKLIPPLWRIDSDFIITFLLRIDFANQQLNVNKRQIVCNRKRKK